MRKTLRERGFSKFKTYTHPATKRSADIRIDKDTGKFACAIGDMKIESLSLPEVEKWARDILKQPESRELKWLPVIQAHVDEGRYGSYGFRGDKDSSERRAELTINARRYWIALADRDPNEKEVWRQLSWVEGDDSDPGCCKPEDRFARSRIFREPIADSGYRSSEMSVAKQKGWVRLPEVEQRTYWIEYTPELWAGIQHVIDVVEHEQSVLHELFKTKAGHAKLVAIGLGKEPLLLGAGKPGKPAKAKG